MTRRIAPYVPGRGQPPWTVSCSLALDGIAGYIVLDPVAPHVASTPLSVSVWCRYDGSTGPLSMLYAVNDSGKNNVLLLRRSGSNTYFDFVTGAVAPAVTRSKTTDLTAGNWHHVVMTWDVGGDDLVRCYVDGGLEFVSNATVTASKAADDLHTVGGEWDPGDPTAEDWWEGPIAQVAIYNRTLPAAEVAVLYGEGHPIDEQACALYRPGHWGHDLPTITDEAGVWDAHGTAVAIDAADVTTEVP